MATRSRTPPPVAIDAVASAITDVAEVTFVLFSAARWRRSGSLSRDTEVADRIRFCMFEALTTSPAGVERLEEIQLVDCREQYEWDAGHVEGAIYLPLNAIMAGAGADLEASGRSS